MSGRALELGLRFEFCSSLELQEQLLHWQPPDFERKIRMFSHLGYSSAHRDSLLENV